MKALITRPRAQAGSFGQALQNAGFEPIYFPVIEIRPLEDLSMLDEAIGNIDSYTWIVFTSVNAVDIFFKQYRKREILLPYIAAIGPKTAEALRRHGIEPYFIPAKYTAEHILPGLRDVRGKRILFPQSEIAGKILEEAIIAEGGFAHPIPVYHTLPAIPDADGLVALKTGVDIITFTSASTVQNFVAIVKQNGLDPLNLPNDPLFACIGPITEQAAREAGLSNLVSAKEYTTEGLIQIISNLETL
ncbi:MAG: uroporphyrinogen-III synthase [Chloroflexi bacterium]|nr:uroporphyrinogen-III synthase [Chloroflexota bacterium]